MMCLFSQERAALASASDPYRYVEKRKPIPDPQDTGLIYGKKKDDPTKSDDQFIQEHLVPKYAIEIT